MGGLLYSLLTCTEQSSALPILVYTVKGEAAPIDLLPQLKRQIQEPKVTLRLARLDPTTLRRTVIVVLEVSGTSVSLCGW